MAKRRGKAKAKKTTAKTKPDQPVTAPVPDIVTPVNQPIVLCRLCENKDGPFLNIFDAEKGIAKKIEDLMPFGVAENDDLPHMICFRCSAKLEELHEFVQKCINTQQNLRVTKPKQQILLWEEKLSNSNISNDDICDAIIKKAMDAIKPVIETKKKSCIEGIKESKDSKTPKESNKVSPTKKTDVESSVDVRPTVKEVKLTLDKCDELMNKTSRTATRSMLNKSLLKINNQNPTSTQTKYLPNDNSNISCQETNVFTGNLNIDNGKNIDTESEKHTVEIKQEYDIIPEKKFDIMDHVSTIKVNGVGVLFQCKICNRNFLKKDVVQSHGCAKTAVPKVTKPVIPPQPRKTSIIKYINTKLESEGKERICVPENSNTQKNPDIVVAGSNNDIKNAAKPKPKIGPASKMKRNEIKPIVGMVVSPMQSASAVNKDSLLVSAQFPTVPSLNCPYKLIPGPNNTFTLVEEQDKKNVSSQSSVKRIAGDDLQNCAQPKQRKLSEITVQKTKIGNNPTIKQEVIPTQPYPVGLFQTMPPSVTAASAIFSAPASKKQSYTVVQTGNPSKLVISAKPQPRAEVVPSTHTKIKNRVEVSSVKQPYSVTLEDASPPQDASFFTFVNVDPLLQPSYVLPTDNIQETPIAMSSTNARSSLESKTEEKEHYRCNMCGEIFSREKKLLAHIHSHYNKMDEEDLLRAEKTIPKPTRKRGSKSSIK